MLNFMVKYSFCEILWWSWYTVPGAAVGPVADDITADAAGDGGALLMLKFFFAQ